MIKSELKKIRGILDESVKYIVPNYQRNFEWRKEHAEEFWEDISANSVFLGNLVLDVHNESENEIVIVDGQQRITTIFIFLAACRYQAKKIKSHDQAAAIKRKISFVDDTSGRASSSKLIPSPSIYDVFIDTIANDKWKGRKFENKNKKKQINKIKPIYEYFLDCISKFDKNDLADILKKLYESTFVKIEIDEPQDAFEIFERTNARGMELNAADLLKNDLFAKNASDKLEEDWEYIVENSSGNLLRMLKYYYVSQHGYTQKKALFKVLKKHGQEIGADKLIQDLKKFSYYYAIITDSSVDNIIEWANETKNKFFLKEYCAQSLNRTLNALQLFGVTQSYPLIIKFMALLSSIKNSEKKCKISDSFLKFINALEKFHFINYAISQRPGNQIEKYYAEKCELNLNEKNIVDNMRKLIVELQREKIVGKAEFYEKFSELSYSSDSHLIYYIFDRLNNFGRKGGQYIEIYNPDRKLLKRNYDIDHLISQNLDNYNFGSKEIGEYIDNVGNLIVISKHTNGSAQNITIREKLKLFKEKETQNLPEVNSIVNEWKSKKWDTSNQVIDSIRERTKKIAEKSFNIVWKM